MKNSKLPYHIKPGFKVPEDYFGNFEQRLMNSVIKENDHPEIVNFNTKNPGYIIPEGYFDDLESRIMEKVEDRPEKVIQLFPVKKLLYATAVAAVCIGIVSTLFLKNTSQEYTMDSIELSALENYIEEGYFDLDFNELSAFMNEEGYSFGEYTTSGISDEAVYNYINENVENPELLYDIE